MFEPTAASCVSADGSIIAVKNEKLNVFNGKTGEIIVNAPGFSVEIFCTENNDVISLENQRSGDAIARKILLHKSARTYELSQPHDPEKKGGQSLEIKSLGLIRNRYFITATRTHIPESGGTSNRRSPRINTGLQKFIIEDLNSKEVKTVTVSLEKLGISEKAFDLNRLSFTPLKIYETGDVLFFLKNSASQNWATYKVNLFDEKLSRLGKLQAFTDGYLQDVFCSNDGELLALKFDVDNKKGSYDKIIRVFETETAREIFSNTIDGDGTSFNSGYPKYFFSLDNETLRVEMEGTRFDPTRSFSEEKFYDLETGKERAVDYKSAFGSLKFSPIISFAGDEFILPCRASDEKTEMCKINARTKEVLWKTIY